MKNKRFRTIIGLFLMPIILTLFILDRVFLVFMIHIESKAIQNYFFDAKQIVQSIWRLVGISIFALIAFLIYNLF